MQPQAGRKNKPNRIAGSANATPERVVMAVKGQRYEAPEGRHSQQTHRIAEARTTAGGYASEKEQMAHDREAMITGLAESAAGKVRHQQRSKAG